LIANSSNNGIQITAAGIGDGWTNPLVQVTTYSQYAYAAGICDQFQKDEFIEWETDAQTAILNGEYSTASGLFDLITGTITNFSNISYYNYRQYPNPDAPEALDSWFANTTVLSMLGLNPATQFQDCNAIMYYAFYTDISVSYVSNISYILTNDINPIPILLYNGQDDLIVNYPGSFGWITEMEWDGNLGFRNAPRNPWYAPNGTLYGWYRQYDNLTFVTVNKAGHMVPADQPASARDMLNRYIYNSWN